TSGIIIVCGPTGSGKTSTLYSALAEINSSDKNIITIEDPVEFNLDGINQIPVNPKIGVDFVTGLTSIVRQDPDVIMIGEIRDFATADIAIQAALTGHLVFTTLHTRSAAGAITRLINMGTQPFLLNSSVIGIIGQRLARVICPNCKRAVDPTSYTGVKEQKIIELVTAEAGPSAKFYRGKGCKFCEDSGYKGRVGIFEIMTISEEVGELIVQKSSSEKIQHAAEADGMRPMAKDAILKINEGITSIEEIARILDI
ncbi:MAG: type II secretory ATPase GspE/PulE/Tfp pilus assembly ATPase PilB-like protein, partial [Candidatus Marinamargulisbacteria bacterium]